MSSIKIVALKGCKMCEELARELSKEDVKYKIIDVDSNSVFCDKLEDSLGVYNYPIAIVEKNNYVYYYYLVSDYKDIAVKKLSAIAYLSGCYSVADMIDNILN
jgi:glutaredoxin